MNSLKFTTYSHSLYSNRPSNMLRNLSSCHILFASQNTSIIRSLFTLIHTHNRISLNNNKSIFLYTHSNTINHKRFFTNFFLSKFWTTKKTLKPVLSNPQKFFDTSTTSNLSITALPANPNTNPTPTPTPEPTIKPISIYPQLSPVFPIPSKHNKLILSPGGSGLPKNSEKLISTRNDEKYHSVGCGEDSFFLRYDALGVADGVGGWRNVSSLRNTGNYSYLFYVLRRATLIKFKKN
jgi:hypothetical protein